jgi:hypothetical protein
MHHSDYGSSSNSNQKVLLYSKQWLARAACAQCCPDGADLPEQLAGGAAGQPLLTAQASTPPLTQEITQHLQVLRR